MSAACPTCGGFHARSQHCAPLPGDVSGAADSWQNSLAQWGRRRYPDASAGMAARRAADAVMPAGAWPSEYPPEE